MATNPYENRIEDLEQFKEDAEKRIAQLEQLVKSALISIDDAERALRKNIYVAQKVENIEGTLSKIVPSIGKIVGKEMK